MSNGLAPLLDRLGNSLMLPHCHTTAREAIAATAAAIPYSWLVQDQPFCNAHTVCAIDMKLVIFYLI